MRKRLLILFFLLAVVACGHPTARIRNDSAVKLQNVHITAQGFEVTIPELQSGESRLIPIKPRGESGVGVAFDANGRHIEVPAQGYIENDSMYVVDITVTPSLTVVVRTDLVAR